MQRPIVFVTDYGRDDAYAAALTGAVWRTDPRLVCVEGTHGVPPGDVLAGAYHLKSLSLAFDQRVVFCAVVDPDVGTGRRAIAIQVGWLLCVAPDNGLVSYLWSEAADPRHAVSIDLPYSTTPTFVGRDLFAPIAAELAAGTRLSACGAAIDDPVILRDAHADRIGSALHGRVALIDHFGNAITTIRLADLNGAAIRSVAWPTGTTTQVVTTYAEVLPGTVGALIGSAGHLELASQRGPVYANGGPGAADAVTVEVS